VFIVGKHFPQEFGTKQLLIKDIAVCMKKLREKERLAVEGINTMIKNLRRTGYGFRDMASGIRNTSF